MNYKYCVGCERNEMHDNFFLNLCEFFRLIQEEKESTELRAEEIENRVGSVSLEGLNLARMHPGRSITGSVTASSLASSSPPISGHSTPKFRARSPARDMDRMGIMTLVSL